YAKGRRKELNNFNFAIVGTRTPTIYGIKMADFFASQLASIGATIVSGLARGVDSAAHRGALKNGTTIAVLGSGLLNIYPKENSKLAKRICENGLVVSEFPLNTPPLRENFPRRNRIISGLSKGVLVVEASSRSGAIITANLALEQNREVFSLPGSIDSPLSKGTNNLIKQGAKLVDSVSDILEEFNINFKQEDKPSPRLSLNSEEETIFKLVKSERSIFLEEIMHKSGLAAPDINRALLQLQIKGIIREIKPLCYTSSL
ncbi:MAG: DNA-protecting protein DprA, partial [Candidatus Omnitrophica bacterium]|nr:DNA-protecting protein DprA [Candidatus Omnitrophota bacterium]MBD3269809.1 DNA-protecting protein DprA [Candidatus Omnitrophota bacterium]